MRQFNRHSQIAAGALSRHPDDVDFVNLLMHRCLAHCKPLPCCGQSGNCPTRDGYQQTHLQRESDKAPS
jgi:hypothetical protein